jgi:predicted metal-dependent HD superfamily phosphohydrolase
MCDIDYSILGQELEIFEEYERGIKYEYCEWGRYSEFEYKEGRKKFLKGVLALPRIYFTNYFFDKYESKARENIKGLLEKLM